MAIEMAVAAARVALTLDQMKGQGFGGEACARGVGNRGSEGPFPARRTPAAAEAASI
jgi:hypothetical protein